jgi:hypothetical protein
VDLAQIGACNDTISLTIQRVAEGDGLVDDFLKFAWRWVVIKSLFNNIGEQMVDLLLAVADGRSSNYGTVESVAEALNLAPAISTAFGTALVVCVDLASGVKEVGGEITTDHSKLSDTTVSKGVKSIIVESAVRVERDSIVVGTEVSEAAISDTCCCTIGDTTRQRVRSRVDLAPSQLLIHKFRIAQAYCKTTTSSTQPSVFEFARRREPVLL